MAKKPTVRRKYTNNCAFCTRVFHPFKRKQRCCSKGCGALDRDRRFRDNSLKRIKAAQAAYTKSRAARVTKMIAGLNTKIEVWRAAVLYGWKSGYAAGRRSR
jgi:hypothetical protein